jgi:glyoxylase-like metal-dependent hydrolase (beta-lactamase superfamily II)
MGATETQRWTVGRYTITSVVEEQTDHVPPAFFFHEGAPERVAAHEWLRPDFADDAGNLSLRVQAFVIEGAGRSLLVDPCVGNGKKRALPFWNEQSWPFLERFEDAGFTPKGIDTVVHTHLHADHVGWDTHLDGDTWVPTFVNARHLYTQRELDAVRRNDNPGIEGVFADSVAPILDAGLADIVEEDADLGEGLRLEPSLGHTPGHVSLWVESDGELALITGDFMHHPVQFAEPQWAEIGDADVEEARETRRRMIGRAADTGALVIGTHFGTRPAGRVVADGAAWRFEPV